MRWCCASRGRGQVWGSVWGSVCGWSSTVNISRWSLECAHNNIEVEAAVSFTTGLKWRHISPTLMSVALTKMMNKLSLLPQRSQTQNTESFGSQAENLPHREVRLRLSCVCRSYLKGRVSGRLLRRTAGCPSHQKLEANFLTLFLLAEQN